MLLVMKVERLKIRVTHLAIAEIPVQIPVQHAQEIITANLLKERVLDVILIVQRARSTSITRDRTNASRYVHQTQQHAHVDT